MCTNCLHKKQNKTYQYWKNVTSKFEGWAVTSIIGGTDKSGVVWLALSVLLGDGGELVSVCVCAKVVIKFLFKWTASYRANNNALLALICWVRVPPSSDMNIFPTILVKDDNHDAFCVSKCCILYCRQKSFKQAVITWPYPFNANSSSKIESLTIYGFAASCFL